MYKVELSKTAAKELQKIYTSDRTVYQRIIKCLEYLAQSPDEGKALTGPLRGLFSYRTGVYRIIYEVYHRQLRVCVVDIGHRKEIYR